MKNNFSLIINRSLFSMRCLECFPFDHQSLSALIRWLCFYFDYQSKFIYCDMLRLFHFNHQSNLKKIVSQDKSCDNGISLKILLNPMQSCSIQHGLLQDFFTLLSWQHMGLQVNGIDLRDWLVTMLKYFWMVLFSWSFGLY